MSSTITDERLKKYAKCNGDGPDMARELLAARARIKELEADRELLEAVQENKWSAQWNTRVQKWTVQRVEQVCGCIGSGDTLREAIRAARGKEGL